MLGEQIILGHKIISINGEKRRIKIPQFVNMESQEVIAFLYSKDHEYLEIYSYNYLMTKLKELDDRISNPRSKDDYDIALYEKNALIYNIVDVKTVSSSDNGSIRVVLPEIACQNLGFENEIYLVAAVDHLELFASEEKFKDIVNAKQKKLTIFNNPNK